MTDPDSPSLTPEQQELKDVVVRLIDSGCHYRLDELAKLYSRDLKIVIVSPDDTVTVFDYEQNMAFFRSRLEAGAAPLDTSARFVHVEVVGDRGYVVVVRHVALVGEARQRIVFSLTLQRSNHKWKIIRESAVITVSA